MSATMSLNGTFDARDFAEVLNLLGRRGSTGRLVVRAGSRHAVIKLSDGQATEVEGVTIGWAEKRHDVRALLEEICFEVLKAGRGAFEFQAEAGVSKGEPVRAVRLATVVAAAEHRLAE